MLLNRASRCFNNFHNVSPCFAVEVAFNASHLSSFSMLVPHNKQEQGCKVNDAFSFRAGQLTHVSKLLKTSCMNIFTYLRHRKRSVSHHPKASQRESPAHRWETIRKSPRHDGILVDIGRIHAYYMRLRRAWAAQKIQFLTRHFQTTSQSNWFDKKKQNRQNRQRSWPQLSSVSALDLATADHSITERLPILARLFYSASQRNSNVQVPAPKPKKQVWWISIS